MAALAATASFAQVTLTGNIDFAGANVSGSQLWAKGSTVSTTVGTASTSAIKITAMEDLGGGMKIGGMYELDPRTFSNDSYAVSNNTGVVASTGAQSSNAYTGSGAVSTVGTVLGQANTATGLGRGEAFLAFSGGFGTLKLGSPNAIGLGGTGASSPLGTGIGSGYTGAGTSGTMMNSVVQTRYNRSVRFDTNAMNGFTVSAMYAPGNDQVATPTTATLSSSTGQATPIVPVANLIPNARQGTEFGLSYANGPLNVAFAYVAQDDQANRTGWYANGTGTQALKTSMNVLGASYTLGATTMYAGWNDGTRLAPTSSTNTAAVDSKGSRFAIKHSVGTVDLMAQYTTQESLGVTGLATTAAVTNGVANSTASTTAVLKAKVTGVRADYNLSKTSAAYIGYEKYDTGAVYAAAAPTTTGTRSLTSIGLRKSF